MRQISKEWSAKDLGDQSGKVAIVTGANSGIGFFTALELGRAGADVIIACRDAQRGQEAMSKLKEQAPGAKFTLESLDLSNLKSVRAFAEKFLASGRALDLLVNNAGVMAIPTRELTADGFERQFGTNHLGHFALTGLLVPALRKAKAPRVVSVSSGLAAMGKFEKDNLQSERKYGPSRTYSNSKLANLLFMLELGRRAPWLTSVSSHPGATHSNLQKHGNVGSNVVMYFIGQQAPVGALPSLYAATGEAATGEYFGPRNLFHMNGPPVQVSLPKQANDLSAARELWDASERLTGVHFELEEQARRSA